MPKGTAPGLQGGSIMADAMNGAELIMQQA
jgi:hypothetical protein